MTHAQITRRGAAQIATLLVGNAAIGAALGVGLSNLQAHPAACAGKTLELDGKLLAACARFHAANLAAYRHAISQSEEEGDALHEALVDAMHEVQGLIPRTSEGLQAKAGVAFAALMDKVRTSMSEDWRAQADPMEALALDVLAQVSGRREA